MTFGSAVHEPPLDPIASTNARHHSIQAERATLALDRMLIRFAKDGAPIDVSFRNMVGPIPVGDQTHSIFPYPARLLRQIPRFFMQCAQLVQPSSSVLDPFCGSGTVLLEASRVGTPSWGIDSNPIARLISTVKTTRLAESEGRKVSAAVLFAAKRSRSAPLPLVINIDRWYTPATQSALARLRQAIDMAQAPGAIHRFLLLSLSITAEHTSLRDPRIPVPVRAPNWRELAATRTTREVWNIFDRTTQRLLERIARLPAAAPPIVAGTDVAHAASTFEQTVSSHIPRPNLVLTSPPYGAAQKYIRSTSLSLGWTGLASTGDLARLERATIGREHLRNDELQDLTVPTPGLGQKIDGIAAISRRRAAIYARYFRAMDNALQSILGILPPEGHIVLIAGSNTVAGQEVDTHLILRDLAIRHGARPVLYLKDTIRGRVLLTKRAGSAAPLNVEAAHLLRKG